MRTRHEVSVAMAVETVGDYSDGAPPHMIFNGRGARTASAEVESEARNDETLTKRWATARVEIHAEHDTKRRDGVKPQFQLTWSGHEELTRARSIDGIRTG